jgi:hypothetical protein
MNISIPVSLDGPDVCRKTLSVIMRFLTTAALVLLTACSRSSPSSTSSINATPAPQASSTISGPCTLITRAEAEAALGKGTTINPKHNPRTDMDECHLTPGNAPGVEEIIILVHPATGWDMVKKSLMEKPVPGMGDDAFVARAVGYNVRKGNNYVQVFGPVTNENAANDKATHYLAERASSRL